MSQGVLFLYVGENYGRKQEKLDENEQRERA